MTTVYIADAGVFVQCGGSDRNKFQRLRRAVQQAGISLRVPQRVYEELGGYPAANAYLSGNMPYPGGFEQGWIVVAGELNYTNPLVSTVMDEARRFIAHETDHDEESIEKADTALVGLVAQLLNPEELVSNIGPGSVSTAVQCLLDVEEPLSASELATHIGVATQTLTNNEAFFADLEAAGLLEREGLGAGLRVGRVTWPGLAPTTGATS